MIFLCFSGKDRHTVVTSILYHLDNYGMDIWYDNYAYILGDNKVINYTTAIEESRYAIIVFSSNFVHSEGALEEINIIYQRYEEGKIHVFPLFYNISITDVPKQFAWLSHLIYNELNDSTGTLSSCNQIFLKYLEDIISTRKYQLELVDETVIPIKPYQYIMDLQKIYNSISSSNTNSRISILYSLFLFINTNVSLPDNLIKGANYLFTKTKLDIEYNFKEISIMNALVTIAVNIYAHSFLPES